MDRVLSKVPVKPAIEDHRDHGDDPPACDNAAFLSADSR